MNTSDADMWSVFQVSLADPDREWKLHNAWFVKPYDFNTRFTSRKMNSGS